MPLYAGEGIDTGASIRKVVIIDRGMSVVNIIVLELRNLKTQIDSVESKPNRMQNCVQDVDASKPMSKPYCGESKI